MAYSTQRALSDGTLREILLTIGFIDREDINVYVDDVKITETGTIPPTDITYEWITDNLIRFSEDIPDGSEVLIQRATELGAVLNVFSAGASFDDPTMDENFLQLLYIAQEAREGSSLAEVFQDIDMHGYHLTNLGLATEPGHAVPLQQMQAESTWAYQSRVAAEAAAATAVSARNAAQLSESNAAGSASAAAGSASAAGASAGNAAASAATAVTNRNEALNFRNEAEGFRDEAEGFRDDAENSALEAAGYAAGVNLPSALGHGGEYLRQRVDEGGFEYRTAAQTRGDLGLGSAALLTATTTNTDKTLGRAMRVGDHGAGVSTSVPPVLGNIDSTGEWSAGNYRAATGSTSGTLPTNYGNVLRWGGGVGNPSSEWLVDLFAGTDDQLRFRTKTNTAAFTGWKTLYHNGNISTASVAHATTAGNAATATKLQTPRTIGGVSFDGTANINLPGVNTAGNQNTSGNAATATRLQTARMINGVAFNGTANITITAAATAASVMAANAAAAFGAVGTVAYLRVADSNTSITAGSTYAGSALRTSGVVNRISSDGNLFGAGGGAAVSGTWRALGTCAANGGSSNFPSTVFLRIS